jgi:hypothetical protein
VPDEGEQCVDCLLLDRQLQDKLTGTEAPEKKRKLDTSRKNIGTYRYLVPEPNLFYTFDFKFPAFL